MKIGLTRREAGGGQVQKLGQDRITFKLPQISSGHYTLAQVDDYMHLRRGQFPHRPPLTLELEARVSAPDLSGTWGFGFWNDPFSAGFGAGGMRRLLPVLPNAAWFFYGSEPNHLSLRDDLPGGGFHARVFRSPLLPSFLSLLAVPALPFFLWPFTARGLRRLARLLVKEDAVQLSMAVTEWHHYQLSWKKEWVDFSVDGKTAFSTSLSPRGKLGLVIWIDNQFFQFTSEGKVGFGFLPVGEEATLEVRNLTLHSTAGMINP